MSDPGGTATNYQLSSINDKECGNACPSTSIDTSTTKPCKNQRGCRRIVRNFTPSWFSVNMGTGITSILLHNLPYNGRWLQYTSYIIFGLNVLLFVTFFAISVVRYTVFPRIWTAMVRHPAQSLFLGTFPMGLATIVNMMAFVCVPSWGGQWWKVTWAIWWIDAAISVACCFSLPFILMTKHHHKISSITGAWLLPIVSTIVAAASGGVVAGVIPHDNEKLITLVVSYVLWATGVPLAMCVITLYLLRLTTDSLPPKAVIVSSFLPLGPLGQGSFGIMQLGKIASEVFPRQHSLPAVQNAGEILYVMGFLIGIIMWGFGLIWLTFAAATIFYSKRFPFNMGWWGFTFPLGVYTLATTTLGSELPSAFFRVLGTIFSLVVTLLWIMVAMGTLVRAWTGDIFVAPCLKEVEDEEREAQRQLVEQQGSEQSV